MSPPVVAVLAAHPADTGPYELLVRFGLRLLPCGEAAQLHARLVAGEAMACVLDATRQRTETLAILARLRGGVQAGIVVVTRPDAIEDRIHALLVGADVCVSASSDPRELAAALLALHRRIAARHEAAPALPSAPASAGPASGLERPPWRCRDDGWQLVAPNGSAVRLSTSERLLLVLLAGRPGQVVLREEIAAALARRRPSPSGAPADGGVGGINMLVSRLRKKARKTGMRLDIETAAGRGYLLASNVIGMPGPG